MSLPCVQELGTNLLNIYTLYQTSFDDDIRAPWPSIEGKLKSGRSRAHVFTENGSPSGFVMWTVHNNSVFIDYFCVSSSLQGRGLGRKYFQWILSYLNSYDNIILDCKRNVVKFYESFGLIVVGDTIWYGGAQTGINLKIMARGSHLDDKSKILEIYSHFQ